MRYFYTAINTIDLFLEIADYNTEKENSRLTLAERIRSFRRVSSKNDPEGWYRKAVLECKRGIRSYNRTLGVGKISK
jgi:hypothetical protein